MKEEKLTFKKGDYIFIGMVAVVVFILFFLQFNAKRGTQIQVTVQGETSVYSLDENQRIPLMGEMGMGEDNAVDAITNIVVIEEGQVYMESAGCPDQVCVKHKPIYRNGEMIICLPNEVYIEVESDTQNEIDN